MGRHHGYRTTAAFRRLILRGVLAGSLVGAAILLTISAKEMRAMLTQLAVTRATNAVNQIVIDAANAAMLEGTFQYERMVSFEKDDAGRITAVKSNMPELNRLQSYILQEVLERVDHVSTRDLAIPLGSLTGSPLLAGRGPLITVRMQSVGSSAAKLENAFVSAGINQTKHQVRLQIDVYVSILLPGFSTATKVSNSIVVAETVIVGTVPETYTYFDANKPMEDSAFDYMINGN